MLYFVQHFSSKPAWSCEMVVLYGTLRHVRRTFSYKMLRFLQHPSPINLMRS